MEPKWEQEGEEESRRRRHERRRRKKRTAASCYLPCRTSRDCRWTRWRLRWAGAWTIRCRRNSWRCGSSARYFHGHCCDMPTHWPTAPSLIGYNNTRTIKRTINRRSLVKKKPPRRAPIRRHRHSGTALWRVAALFVESTSDQSAPWQKVKATGQRTWLGCLINS